MNLEEFRSHLLEYGIFIMRDYPVQKAQCFECHQMIVFFNKNNQDTVISFNINTPPKSVAFYILGFLENLPAANNLTVMNSHYRNENGYIIVENEELMIEQREKNEVADNILLNSKCWEC